MFRPQMTDVSGNSTSQYAIVAPISVSTDISPSRQTRESSNKFLQEHTIISELKKKDRAPGKLKYVDVEFTNAATEQRVETTRRDGPTVVNTNYEDWTVPRPRPRKQPPPPPTTKPKPVYKAKSIAQMVVPADTEVAGETVKTKARCASETDTVDDERMQHQQQPVNNFSLKRPSRKAPPPPKQLQHTQNDKESVPQSTQKAKSPRPLQQTIGNDKDVVDLAPLSPKQRRALSSEKEIVETSSQGHQVKRTSSFKEGKVLRPVRKAPPPPNKSTEYINVAKDDDDVTFSTFFVSHKKAQSLSYENVVCDETNASMLGTFPRSHQSYENVERGRKAHRSDEGHHRGNGHSYENVLTTRQAIENKLNKASCKPNNVDMNKVDSNPDASTINQQQEVPRSNGGIHYQRQGGKKKSVRKKPNISPPHTPPPPPPEPPGGPSTSPEAPIELATASLPEPYPKKLKKPLAPPPPPPGTARKPNVPPPRPPPPDESQPPSIPPPPPPDDTQPVNGEIPPRPPPPPGEAEAEPSNMIPGILERTCNMHSRVENSEQVFIAASNTTPLSPPLINAKKPLTSPPASPPPPPPLPSSSLSSTVPTPGTPDDQKLASFELQGSDVEAESPSISTSSSEASLHQQQVIRQQHNGDVDNDLHADIITSYTTPPDFFGHPSRELDPITEYADTESSGSVYITRTVSDEALNWNSDQQISSDNSPELKRLAGDSEGSRRPLQKVQSPLVGVNTTATQNGGSVLNPETDTTSNHNTVEQHAPDDGPMSKERKETSANPFWYRESMIMAVGRGNALHGYPSKKRPVPPPRGSQSADPPVIENMESSPARIRRPPEDTDDKEITEDVEINLAYVDSLNGSSLSGSFPVPPPRARQSNKETKIPPAAPPRDRSSLSSSPARNPEKSKAAFTRVRAASFLTVSAGKELNTVTAMYMGSKQVDQYVGQINNIARDLSDKAASPMILYIATEKIRLAAPDSNVLFQSFAVENILATTLCPINKRIVGMLVWKSRALPSWHLIRCSDNLVAGSVLESIQMACETVKSDEITEVRDMVFV